jgi:hypothetical protein
MQGLGPRVRAHTARQPGAVLADAFATLAGRIGDRRIRFAARRTHPLLLLVVLVASGLAHAPVHAQTFAPALNVSNTRADSFSPQMAVVSPHVYVAWLEGKSLFSRSTNSGQSFSALCRSSPFASMQRIAATGSNVYGIQRPTEAQAA